MDYVYLVFSGDEVVKVFTTKTDAQNYIDIEDNSFDIYPYWIQEWEIE